MCIDSSLLAQALEASQLRGHAVTVPPSYPSFSELCESVCGELASPSVTHLSDFIAGALKCSAIMMSKALPWLARIGQTPSLQKKRSRPSPSLDPPERPKKHRRDPSPDGSGRGGGEVGKVLTSLFETAVNALLHSQQR